MKVKTEKQLNLPQLIECTNTKCKIQPSTWLRVETDSVNKLVKIWNTRNYKEC